MLAETLLMALMVLLVGGAVVHERRRRKHLQHNLHLLSEAMGGECIDTIRPHARWGAAEVDLPHGRLAISYEQIYYGRSSHPFTSAYYRSSSDLPEMDIYPQGILHTLGTFIGMQDIQVGDSAFDAAFILQCSDEPFLISFLNWRARATIRDQLAELSSGFQLSVRANELSVRYEGHMSDLTDLKQLHRSCVKLIAELERAAGHGELAAAPRAALPAAPASFTPVAAAKDCAACLRTLDHGATVHCKRCGAVHHALCWEMRGMCAVASCQGFDAV